MTNLLPGLFRSFVLALLCLALAGCRSDADSLKPASVQTAATMPPDPVLTTALSTGQTGAVPVKAEIMDIAQAASGKVWAVAIRFSGGECKPCRVDVHDGGNGRLLASDEVRGIPAGDGIHETQFEYRGSPERLRIAVTDVSNSEVLAEK